ncbi:MAG: methionine adenosyltransferase [Dehalococcoidia bacterium]|jgi:S-adenosylmethionine synthetase|nr:methionine adenosyltransferase [Dehalococcoidia bacterium]MDP7470582.1 methionine adenosyltransferase [Dehalococcoidia bacterium]
MKSSGVYFTSESVTEGHPDKLCDQVSDSILDSILDKDPMGRVACETAVTNGLVLVMGEITTDCYVDITAITRNVVKETGYIRPEYRFDHESCGVMVSIQEQSPDIGQGVTQSLEWRRGSRDELDKVGAGDQGMMVGFACNETPEYMPLPISLAHKLCAKLAQARKENVVPYLRPDGKAQVTVEYCYGEPKGVDAIVIAAQHDPDVPAEKIRDDVYEAVVRPVVPSHLLEEVYSRQRLFVNTTGSFVIGGPAADSGLTGRKLLVDTYGGFARIGGGAFSGKDPSKVDRSAAYIARYIAKNVVAAGLADRFEIQLSYAIGVANPLSMFVESFGSGKVPDEVLLALVQKHFDTRPAAIIQNLQLLRPIYRDTAAYGHFGRDGADFPWERTDKAEALRQDAGLG